MTLGNIYYIDPKDLEKIMNADTTDEMWNAFCDTEALYTVQPFAGGLDHITATKNQITFHDIGVSRGSGVIDNTFTLRRRK